MKNKNKKEKERENQAKTVLEKTKRKIAQKKLAELEPENSVMWRN